MFIRCVLRWEKEDNGNVRGAFISRKSAEREYFMRCMPYFIRNNIFGKVDSHLLNDLSRCCGRIIKYTKINKS